MELLATRTLGFNEARTTLLLSSSVTNLIYIYLFGLW